MSPSRPGQPVTCVFTSTRQKKRFLQTRWRNRAFNRARRYPRRSHGCCTVRDLVAPSLAGRYALAVTVQQTHDEDPLEDSTLIETLRGSIPGRFKVTYLRSGRRAARQYGQLNVRTVINRIYLTHENDLFLLLLAFKPRIRRVMRLLSAPPGPAATAQDGAGTAAPAAPSTARLPTR